MQRADSTRLNPGKREIQPVQARARDLPEKYSTQVVRQCCRGDGCPPAL